MGLLNENELCLVKLRLVKLLDLQLHGHGSSSNENEKRHSVNENEIHQLPSPVPAGDAAGPLAIERETRTRQTRQGNEDQ